MKELLESLWKVAPRLMSVIVILSIMFFIAHEIVTFQQRLDNMDKRLTNLEIRMDRVEKKLDTIIEYILADRAERALRRNQEQPTGK